MMVSWDMLKQGVTPIGVAFFILTRPTGQAIFQLFQYVNVILLELPDGRIQRSLDRSLTPDQRRILQGLGMDESIYV
ncbi:hypothetical protein GS458_1933 [Geobacillus stearothermophilus]|nr:hypothetical protein GS458_1933 [Geobacillus stearothermophilus]